MTKPRHQKHARNGAVLDGRGNPSPATLTSWLHARATRAQAAALNARSAANALLENAKHARPGWQKLPVKGLRRKMIRATLWPAGPCNHPGLDPYRTRDAASRAATRAFVDSFMRYLEGEGDLDRQRFAWKPEPCPCGYWHVVRDES